MTTDPSMVPPIEAVEEAFYERVAQVSWKIQQLPGEDAFEHRVRVVREVLRAAELFTADVVGKPTRRDLERGEELAREHGWD